MIDISIFSDFFNRLKYPEKMVTGRWIETKKRFPNYGFDAIICTSKHKITIGYYSEDGKWRMCDEVIDDVILWQPLPPLPKNMPIIELDFDDLEYSARGGLIMPPRSQTG